MYSAFFLYSFLMGRSFRLARRILIIGSYFTNYSKTITRQAEIFQEKLSTIVIFIPCKLCVNLWTFLFFGLTNVVPGASNWITSKGNFCPSHLSNFSPSQVWVTQFTVHKLTDSSEQHCKPHAVYTVLKPWPPSTTKGPNKHIWMSINSPWSLSSNHGNIPVDFEATAIIDRWVSAIRMCSFPPHL